MKPTLALSSCWNSFRHTDGYVMLREIADLGFTHVELSHGIRIVLVPGILKAIEEGMVQISSTHNFCPLPTGITQAAPNLFEPTIKEMREHEQWLRHTKRSIDFAVQIKARVMVMHLGSVKFFWMSPARKLQSYLKAKPDAVLQRDKNYEAILRKSCLKLRKQMDPYWLQLLASLEKIRAYALDKGIAVGCENREKFEELPIDDDFEAMFTALVTPNPFGYWHDTGHAEIKQGFGLLDHRLHLEKNAARLLGFHLHDVSAQGKDHQCVGSGRVNFEMISQFWQPHHLLTLELSPRVTTEEIMISKQRIEALMATRFGS